MAWPTTSVSTGMARNLTSDDTATGCTHERTPLKFSAAPTHSRPSGIEATPSERTAGSINVGTCTPAICMAMPNTHATTSGFVTIWRASALPLSRTEPKRANTSTHSRLTVGTMAALHTAASAMPLAPKSPAASDTPT